MSAQCPVRTTVNFTNVRGEGWLLAKWLMLLASLSQTVIILVVMVTVRGRAFAGAVRTVVLGDGRDPGPKKTRHPPAGPTRESARPRRDYIASLPLQSSLMSKTYLKSDHFNGGASRGRGQKVRAGAWPNAPPQITSSFQDTGLRKRR